MPKLHNKSRLPYNIHFLYDIITDVEKYGEFIPWCEKVTIVEQKDQEIISDVTVKFLFIREYYRSVARLSPPFSNNDTSMQASVKIEMIHGPFKYFLTSWEITAISDNETEIDFKCDFEFNKKLYNTLVSPILPKANNKIFTSFKKRAANLANKK